MPHDPALFADAPLPWKLDETRRLITAVRDRHGELVSASWARSAQIVAIVNEAPALEARVAALEAERASWLEQARIAIDRVVRVAKERDDLRGLLNVLLANSLVNNTPRAVRREDCPGLFVEGDLELLTPISAMARAVNREPAT